MEVIRSSGRIHSDGAANKSETLISRIAGTQRQLNDSSRTETPKPYPRSIAENMSLHQRVGIDMITISMMTGFRIRLMAAASDHTGIDDVAVAYTCSNINATFYAGRRRISF